MDKPQVAQESPKILASQIEIHSPIEIIDPRATRYSVGQRFSELYWDADFHSWVAVSRKSGGKALIGPNNVKGVTFANDPNQPQKGRKPTKPQPQKAQEPAKVG